MSTMGDAVGTVGVYFCTAIIMFGAPLIINSASNDDMAQTALNVAVTEAAENVEKTGVFTIEDYNNLVQTVSADGTAKEIEMQIGRIEIEMQIGRIDENPAKKTTQANSKKQGENAMYYIFTNEIEEILKTEGKIVLNQGDVLIIRVRNKSPTLNNMLTNIFYSVPPSATYTLASQASITCTVNGDLSN